MVSEIGTLKLTDFGISKKYINPYSIFEGEPLYLSPEARKLYKNINNTGNCYNLLDNPFKSDVYSLGLVFLHMASLKNTKKLANLDRLEEKISKRIKKISDKYSIIKQLLEKMLIVNEINRPDLAELKEFYKEIIGGLSPGENNESLWDRSELQRSPDSISLDKYRCIEGSEESSLDNLRNSTEFSESSQQRVRCK